MVGITIISFIVVIIFLLYIVFNPKLDYILVKGKKKRIVWYNSKDGRDWMFL